MITTMAELNAAKERYSKLIEETKSLSHDEFIAYLSGPKGKELEAARAALLDAAIWLISVKPQIE